MTSTEAEAKADPSACHGFFGSIFIQAAQRVKKHGFVDRFGPKFTLSWEMTHLH